MVPGLLVEEDAVASGVLWLKVDWGISVGKYMRMRSLKLRDLSYSSVVQWQTLSHGIR